MAPPKCIVRFESPVAKSVTPSALSAIADAALPVADTDISIRAEPAPAVLPADAKTTFGVSAPEGPAAAPECPLPPPQPASSITMATAPVPRRVIPTRRFAPLDIFDPFGLR